MGNLYRWMKVVELTDEILDLLLGAGGNAEKVVNVPSHKKRLVVSTISKDPRC